MDNFYVTTYCNFAHDVETGDPIDHECIQIPPEALEAEMDGDYDKAIAIMEGKGGVRTMKIVRDFSTEMAQQHDVVVPVPGSVTEPERKILLRSIKAVFQPYSGNVTVAVAACSRPTADIKLRYWGDNKREEVIAVVEKSIPGYRDWIKKVG